MKESASPLMMWDLLTPRSRGSRQALDLGDHAAVDYAGFDKCLGLLPGQGRQQLTVAVLHAVLIGHQDQFLRPDFPGDGAGDFIGIDVVPWVRRPPVPEVIAVTIGTASAGSWSSRDASTRSGSPT